MAGPLISFICEDHFNFFHVLFHHEIILHYPILLILLKILFKLTIMVKDIFMHKIIAHFFANWLNHTLFTSCLEKPDLSLYFPLL